MGAGGSSADASGGDPDMPEHDLEPPRFARRALERLLGDWKAVRAMMLTGAKAGKVSKDDDAAEQDQQNGHVYEEQAFLVWGTSRRILCVIKCNFFFLLKESQNGTALLDKFTHCLLVKCSSEMLDTLLTTLIKQLQTTAGDADVAKEVKVITKRWDFDRIHAK